MPKTEKTQQNKKFWNFIPDTANKTAELILYGDISSYSWWDDDITPQQFNKDLADIGDVEEIVVRINSGGGDVFAANAIYTRLKDHKAKITVKIDGWAASAATIVAMAGDVIEIPANGVFMIHDPKMSAFGYYSSEEFTKLSDELKVIKQSIINGYALKTKKDQEEIANLMALETWYTGDEAVENGFCDKIMFEDVETEIENSSRIVVNSVEFDIAKYKNLPQILLKRTLNHHIANHSSRSLYNNREVRTMDGEIKTVDELRAAYPDLVGEIEKSAETKERERIKNIENVAIEGFEEIVNEAKFEKPIPAADLAMKIISEQKKLGANYLENRETDINNSKIKDVGNGNSINGSDEVNLYDAAIDKLFPEKK